MSDDKPTWKRYAGLMLLALMIWGVIIAVQMMDNEEIKSQFKDNRLATSGKFFLFSQAFGSVTPVWKIPIGESEFYLPYPDGTDIFGLLLFAMIAQIIISCSRLKENKVGAWIFYVLFLIFGWFVWKLIMYILFVYLGQSLGSTYAELVAIRAGAIDRGLKMGVPLLVLTMITFFANFGALTMDD